VWVSDAPMTNVTLRGKCRDGGSSFARPVSLPHLYTARADRSAGLGDQPRRLPGPRCPRSGVPVAAVDVWSYRDLPGRPRNVASQPAPKRLHCGRTPNSESRVDAASTLPMRLRPVSPPTPISAWLGLDRPCDEPTPSGPRDLRPARLRFCGRRFAFAESQIRNANCRIAAIRIIASSAISTIVVPGLIAAPSRTSRVYRARRRAERPRPRP
jgi:hypothetical protein